MSAAVLAVCGFSGSGKTTLIERVLPPLLARGLAVAVVKHDAHGLSVDHPGKDSDRFFRAGADVHLAGPGEGLLRAHRCGLHDPIVTVRRLSADHDVILVEGHKATPLPKVWVAGPEGTPPPPQVSHVLAVLERDDDPEARLTAVIDRRLDDAVSCGTVLGGLLTGGWNRRRERPRQRRDFGGVSCLEHARRVLAPLVARVIPLGSGQMPADWIGPPCLPDAPGVPGPLAGVLSALRWAPEASWLIGDCDQFRRSSGVVSWLLSHRAPGRWVIMMEREDGRPEPFPLLLEPQAGGLFEELARSDIPAPHLLAGMEHVHTVACPPEFSAAFADAMNLDCHPLRA